MFLTLSGYPFPVWKKLHKNYLWTTELEMMWQSPWFHLFYILPSSHRSSWTKIYKSLTHRSKKKRTQNLGIISFENQGVRFIIIAPVLRYPRIVKTLPSSSVQFPMQILTYRVNPPISTKFFNLNKFVNNLHLDLFFNKHRLFTMSM